MSKDRQKFYLRRKERIIQALFQRVNTTATTNWIHIAERQSLLREELNLVEELIKITGQSVYQSTRKR